MWMESSKLISSNDETQRFHQILYAPINPAIRYWENTQNSECNLAPV